MENEQNLNIKYSAAYFFTIIIFLAAALIPDQRVWGFNLWTYWDKYITISIFLTGIIFYFLIERNYVKLPENENSSSKKYLFISSVPLISGLIFYLFRTKLHFLGDGISLINNLSSKYPIFKNRNFGEELFHHQLYNLIKNSDNASVMTYQSLSIFAGMIFVFLTVFYAYRLFEKPASRLLFILTIIFSGQMLLYFGYVENYSLFNVAILWFLLVALDILKNNKNSYFILIPLVLTIFFHIFGIFFIPAALYLIFRKSSLMKKWRSVAQKTRILVILIFLIISIAVYIYLTSNILIFQITFIPVFNNRFNIDGYTLFSIRHLLDMINLLFLFVPGLLLFLLIFINNKDDNKRLSNYLEYIAFTLNYLFITAFIIDPKLGTANDWDLFAYFGTTLVVFTSFIVASYIQSDISYKKYLILLPILSLFSLVPRVAAQTSQDSALKVAIYYQNLDQKKNRHLFQAISEYAQENNMYDLKKDNYTRYKQVYPETDYLNYGKELVDQKKYREAIQQFHRTLKINPIYHACYYNIGLCYKYMNIIDSAFYYFDLSIAINEYNELAYYEKGNIYLIRGDLEKALEEYQKCIKVRPDFFLVLINTAAVYDELKEFDKAKEILLKIKDNPKIPSIGIKKLGDYYYNEKNFSEAKKYYQIAINKGLNSDVEKILRQRFPDLK